jgi:putative ABC transport system substrate-binding protein
MNICSMKRREFITLLGGAVGWPLAARAQQPIGVRRIGVLMPYPESDTETQARIAGFRDELRRFGWRESENVKIDLRWSTDNLDRVRADMADIISLKPDVILITGQRVVPIVQQQTRSIPTVFVSIGDPVDQGLVTSLARPGGNITGFTLGEFSLGGKRLEMLKEITPALASVGFIFNPDNPATVLSRRLFEVAAQSLSLQPLSLPVHNAAEIEGAIDAFAKEKGAGLFFPADVTTFIHRDLAIRLAARHRLPAIYSNRTYAVGGGLMSYGPDQLDLYRRSASYVDRILRGEKPGELPIQLPTKFQFVLNLKTAKALGLTVPLTLQVAADEVIE